MEASFLGYLSLSSPSRALKTHARRETNKLENVSPLILNYYQIQAL